MTDSVASCHVDEIWCHPVLKFARLLSEAAARFDQFGQAGLYVGKANAFPPSPPLDLSRHCSSAFSPTINSQGEIMNVNSPLETLVAFAIVFATGALYMLGMTRYLEKIRREAHSGR